jgi:hypothetical protein
MGADAAFTLDEEPAGPLVRRVGCDLAALGFLTMALAPLAPSRFRRSGASP